jgi:hypothetical protein
MKLICFSFPKCVVDTISSSASFCALIPGGSFGMHSQHSVDHMLSHFQLLDSVCTCGLPSSDPAVDMAELRRRALVSDVLPAVGTLWLSAEPLVKRALSRLTGRAKASVAYDTAEDELVCTYVNFVSSMRAIFGMIHCFHRNRSVDLQASSRRVLDSIDVLIKECVVNAAPSHRVSCAVAGGLAVALLDHGIDLPHTARHLRASPADSAVATATNGGSGGGGDTSKENDFLSVFGRMLANSSAKAAQLADQEDYPDGEDGRHSLLRILVPALARVVRYAAVISPHVAFWALHEITRAWLIHPTSWHWAYQIFYEEVLQLGRRAGQIGAAEGVADSVLMQMLTSYPELAAEDFLISLICSESTLLVEIIENILAIGDIEKFLDFYIHHIISRVVLTGDLPTFRVLAKRFPGLIFRYDNAAGEYDLSLSSLLESTPQILYGMLMSDQMQKLDEVNIVRHNLPQRLLESIRALKLSSKFDIRTAKPTGGRSLQRYLLHAIWDTGASTWGSDGSAGSASPGSRQEQAEKALRVISAIYTTDSWVGGSMEDESEDNPWRKYAHRPSPGRRKKGGSGATDTIAIHKTAMREFTADLIPAHFLYIMSHLIQKNWGSQSLHRKEQAVNTVISLVRLVRPDTISKFLPKVIVAIDAALCSSSARVRSAGVKLTSEVCARLPLDALTGNVSALVVVLFPILESFSSKADDEAALLSRGAEGQSAPVGVKPSKQALSEGQEGSKFTDLRSCFTFKSPDSFAPVCFVDPKLPKIGGLLAELAFYEPIEAAFKKEAFELAVETVRGIFLGERPEADELLAAVPFIPDIPELAELRSKHSSLLESSTFEQSVRRLCGMLRHESSQVRVVVLRRLLALIREKRGVLFSAELSLVAAQSESLLSVTVTHLLSLCARESDRTAKDVCARCLGLLYLHVFI